MSASSISGVPFQVQAVPTEVRVLFSQVLVEQATAQMVAENVARSQAATQALVQQPDGTGSVVNKVA